MENVDRCMTEAQLKRLKLGQGMLRGGIYKHYKGNHYYVLGVAFDTDDVDGPLRVNYVAMYPPYIHFSRTIDKWFGTVENLPYAFAPVKRYTLVMSEDHPDFVKTYAELLVS